MDLKFIKLVIRDFKAFQGKHTFALDRPSGLYFMRGRNDDEKRLGSNGVGKSSLWDAVCWCLYGRTPGGLRNPDIKPWEGSTSTWVTLFIQAGTRSYKITRATNPNALKLDNTDVGQEAIERLVRMSFEVTTNTIILGQRRPLFFDMGPTEKMQLLSDVKQLDRWDERSKAAADKTKALELELASFEGEVIGLEQSQKTIDRMLVEANDQAAVWQQDYDARMAEAAQFEKKHGKRMAQLQEQVDRADLRYDGSMTEVKALERQVVDIAGIVARARSSLVSVKEGRQRRLAYIVGLEAELEGLKRAKVCPTCGQSIVSTELKKHKQEILDKITELNKELGKLSINAEKRAYAVAEKNLAKADRYLATFHAKADEAIGVQKKAQGELSELQEQLKAIKRATDEGERNPYSLQARSLRKRMKRALSDLADARSDIKSCARELERAKFWVKGFKDIKLHVIEELLQELELTTAGMLEEIGLIGWSVKYAIERETKSGKTSRALSVLVKSNKSSGLVRWESWSGGEGQRLRVVGALALAEVLLNHAGVRSNIEVLDEPTTSLSDEGVHDLCDYLSDRAQAMGRVIFYCDHQSIDSVRFMGTITIRKGPEGARIARDVS